jgi:hypothetical protein
MIGQDAWQMSGVAQDQEPGEPGCHADREGEARFLLPRPWSPLLIGEGSRLRGPLTDLAVDLAAKSAGFRRSLLPGVLTALADLVRSMNCYYSNLIEGHDTHPVDIERALKSDYSADPEKRDLQLEAKTRSGRPCRSPPVTGRRRCRMHGGAAGSGAPRSNQNALKNGLYTREAVEERRRLRCLLREAWLTINKPK